MVMKMKWLLCMMVMVAALATTAQADVYIAGRYSGSRDAMETFLNANFSAETLGTIHKANYRDAGVPGATKDDLVIFLRETASAWYDDNSAEITAWGDIVAPVLHMAPHTAELQRMGWTTNGGQMTVAATGAETEVLDSSDPLFADITITDGYADLADFDFAAQATLDLLPAGSSVLAEGDSGGTANVILARIPTGASYNSTAAGGVSGVHAGPRMIFYVCDGENNLGIDAYLTDDGKTVLANCVQDLFNEQYKPVVNAGPDQAITTLSTSLAGAAVNPDPNDTLTYLWTADAGVTFGDDEDPNTTVTFPGFGLYVVTMTATNTIPLSSSNSLSVFVIDPGDASDPDPADGATGVGNAPTLSWTAGADAVTRDVWFGKDAGDMELVLDDQTDLTYVPGTLVKGETYYWAVDDTDSGAVTHEGTIWSFTVAPLVGTTSWTGGDGGSNLWNIEANWNNGVPGVGTAADIKLTGPALIDSTVEAVATGTWSRWGLAAAVTDPNIVPTVLNMTGGSLTVKGWALGNTGPAIVNIIDGTITTGGNLIIGDSVDIGDVTLNISGGTVNVGGELRLYDRTHSRINLTGGVLYAKNIRLWSAADRSQIIDLAGGILVMPGDQTVELNSIVGHSVMGGFIAFDGTGSVMVSYDEVADETTVAGCAYLLTADASGDCAVNEADLELMVTDWLYTTPAEAGWSFDMASDPVGTGEWDLVVRGDDPANANYTMGDDTGTGTMEVTGAGTLLLDQQYEGTVGLFDTDVHYVIKSTNEYATDLWVYMATSAEEGRQATVGISTMQNIVVDSIDPNIVTTSQTVEIWDGTKARQQNGYNPAVVETDLDPNTYLTIDVNYDYDTDTFDYTISDGSETRQGFDVSYTSSGTGDGGFFTLKSGSYGGGAGNASPGSALIDQLNMTIHGSAPVIKPGDADRDGDVDLSDFAALAEEWLLDGTL